MGDKFDATTAQAGVRKHRDRVRRGLAKMARHSAPSGATVQTNVVLWLDQSGSMSDTNYEGLTGSFLKMLQEELAALPGARITRIDFGPGDNSVFNTSTEMKSCETYVARPYRVKCVNADPAQMPLTAQHGGGTPLYYTLYDTQPVLEELLGSNRNANNAFLGIVFTDGFGDDGLYYGPEVQAMWQQAQASGMWTYVFIDTSGAGESQNADLVQTLPPGSVLQCQTISDAEGPVREGIRRFARLRKVGVQATEHFLDGADAALQEDALW